MAIRIKCDQCGKIGDVPDEYAGRRAKCPCGATIMIPSADAVPSEGAPQEKAAPSRRPASRARAAGRRPIAHRRGPRRAPKGYRKGARAGGWQMALLGGGVVALIALVLAIVLVSRGGPAALDDVVEDPFKGVPAGAVGIGCVSLREAAEFGLVDAIIRRAKGDTPSRGGYDPETIDVAAVLKSSNINPRKDLDIAVIAASDAKGAGAAIVTGRFDKRAILRTVSEYRARKSSYKGYDLVELGDGLQLAIVNSRLMVAGHIAGVKRIIDVLAGGVEAISKDSPLLAKARRFSNETFWFAADPAIVRLPGAPKGQDQAPGPDLSALKGLVVYGKARYDTFDIGAELTCEDAKASEKLTGELKDAIEGLKVMAALFTADDAEAGRLVRELIRSITVESEGKSAAISFRIRRRLIEKLGPLAGKMQPPAVAHAPEQTPEQAPEQTPQPPPPPQAPARMDEQVAVASVEEENLDAPVVLGATYRQLLPVYDHRLEETKLISALDLSIFDNVYLRPGKAEEADDFDPGKIFAGARQGHIYLTKEGKIVSVGGTAVAPLQLPRAVAVGAGGFAGRLGQMTLRQVVEQLKSYIEANPVAGGRSLDAEENATFVVSTREGKLVGVEVLSVAPDTASLVLVPIGAASACQAQLTRIVAACNQYVADKGGGRLYPRSLRQLVQEDFIVDQVLACPADKGAKEQKRNSYESAFDLTERQIPADSLPGNMILVWDKEPRHGGARCAGFVDGSAKILSEESFQRRLNMLKAYLNKPAPKK